LENKDKILKHTSITLQQYTQQFEPGNFNDSVFLPIDNPYHTSIKMGLTQNNFQKVSLNQATIQDNSFWQMGSVGSYVLEYVAVRSGE
jgi:hypothetical protein